MSVSLINTYEFLNIVDVYFERAQAHGSRVFVSQASRPASKRLPQLFELGASLPPGVLWRQSWGHPETGQRHCFFVVVFLGTCPVVRTDDCCLAFLCTARLASASLPSLPSLPALEAYCAYHCGHHELLYARDGKAALLESCGGSLQHVEAHTHTCVAQPVLPVVAFNVLCYMIFLNSRGS